MPPRTLSHRARRARLPLLGLPGLRKLPRRKPPRSSTTPFPPPPTRRISFSAAAALIRLKHGSAPVPLQDAPLPDAPLPDAPLPDAPLPLTLRPYQAEALAALGAACERGGTHSVVMARGTGERVVIASLFAALNRAPPRGASTARFALLAPTVHFATKLAAELAVWAPGVEFEVSTGGSLPALRWPLVICLHNFAWAIANVDFEVVVAVDSEPDAQQGAAGEPSPPAVLRARARLDFSAVPNSERAPCFNFGIREAINAGVLCDYIVAVPVFAGGHRARNLAALVAERPAWERVLAYCNTWKEAKEFCALLREAGVPAAVLGYKPKACIRSFEGARAVFSAPSEAGELRALVTVDSLSESVDAPGADCCLFVEPRGNRIDILGCIARVLRRAPGKGRSVVVLPTTDEVEHRILQKFCAAICAADPAFAAARESWLAGGRTSQKFALEFSAQALAEREAGVLREEAYERFGEALAGSWEWMFRLLVEFRREFGRLPTSKDVYRGKRLGRWLDTQRQAKRGKGTWKITPAKVARLSAIDPGMWGPQAPRYEFWERKFALLVEFQREFRRLPTRGEVYRGEALGVWLSTQRSARRAGGRISAKRAERLSALDPDFSDEADNRNWERNFSLLGEFRVRFGRLPTSAELYRGERLGAWLQNQRASKRSGARRKITAEQIARLTGLDPDIWEVERRRERLWESKFALLAEFRAEHGRLPTNTEVYRGERLGSWLHNQRSAKRGVATRKLPDYRAAQLTALDPNIWGNAE